jgi:photosystem II stability/assembly factor-like uncharacterized protein
MKVVIIILYSAVALSTCIERKIVSSNITNQSVSDTTNKENKTNIDSRVDWRNVPRIKCVSSSNKEEIWLTTADGLKILHSKDEGINWVVLSEHRAKCIDFVDKNHGWLIDEYSKVWFTDDGGNKWSQKKANVIFSSPEQIKFRDLSNGWIKGFLIKN